MYSVYILINKYKNKTYTGHTRDIGKRLEEHNTGKNIFTRSGQPWNLFHIEKYDTKSEAIVREKYLKSCAGRKFIKKLFYIPE